METRIPVRKDSEVLVVASKHIGQFDLPVINPAIKAISNILTRAICRTHAKSW